MPAPVEGIFSPQSLSLDNALQPTVSNLAQGGVKEVGKGRKGWDRKRGEGRGVSIRSYL